MSPWAGCLLFWWTMAYQHASRDGTRDASTDNGNSRLDAGGHASPSQRPETGGRYGQPVNCVIPDRAYLCAKLCHVVGRALRLRLRLWRQHNTRPDVHRIAHKNVSDTAALSGMAQCVGYLMAAAAPSLLGQLHDWTGGSTAPLLITSAIAIAEHSPA